MKVQFEEVNTAPDSSFRILVNPKLNDFFYWHFHPEYELVFIEGADGTRHVGDHISQYTNSDMVFIGSNIPHLNFDYGIRTPYEKSVLQIRADFPEGLLGTIPEVQHLKNLFELAHHGIAFSQDVKMRIGPLMKKLHHQDNYPQFLSVLEILNTLAHDQGMVLLHEEAFKGTFKKREKEKLRRIYRHIDEHYDRKISIDEVAGISNLSKEAFCRYFKKMTKLTFTEFLNHYRINMAKKLLIQDNNVSETCFRCGFESLSYFNRVFKRITEESPSIFRKKYNR